GNRKMPAAGYRKFFHRIRIQIPADPGFASGKVALGAKLCTQCIPELIFIKAGNHEIHTQRTAPQTAPHYI
ncbi:MAG: hypothetical protein MK183_02075, partial [Verrucomicrobiales bacterium]|nr:hypothetical protein [Verrucomicrobiales bacterium]